MIMKRICMPNTWPIARKGRMKFILAPRASAQNSVSLLVALRDMLKIAKTRREARILLLAGQVVVNGKIRKDDSFPLRFFDVMALPQLKKYFRLGVTKSRKFALEEISERDAGHRICKIIGKEILNGNKIQLNLDNGYNVLSDGRANVNDSVVLSLGDSKITGILHFKEGAKAISYGGKHIGLSGEVKEINNNDKTAIIKASAGAVKIQIKNILVIE